MVSKVLLVAAAFGSSAYAVTGVSRLYAQCGGKNYSGATQCETGSVCKVQNDYYHQCVADDSASDAGDSCSVQYITLQPGQSAPTSSAESAYPSSSAAASAYTTSSAAASYSAPAYSSSASAAAPSSSSVYISSSAAASSYSAPAYSSSAAPVESSSSAAPVESSSSSAAPVQSSPSAYSAPAASSTSTQAATSAQSTSPAATGVSSGSGTTYKASFTEYGSTDTWGSGNCNVATTACGFYSSPGYAAAVSQNEFGVGPGAGAGPACGKCFKLTAETDSSGNAVSGFGAAIVVQVTNLCPASGNPLCSQNGLTGTNQYGANLNFDLCIDSGASAALFGSSGVGLAVGSAVEVDCSQWSGSIVH